MPEYSGGKPLGGELRRPGRPTSPSPPAGERDAAVALGLCDAPAQSADLRLLRPPRRQRDFVRGALQARPIALPA